MLLSFLASRPLSMTILAFFPCGFYTKEKIFLTFLRKKTLRQKRRPKKGAPRSKTSFYPLAAGFSKARLPYAVFSPL